MINVKRTLRRIGRLISRPEVILSIAAPVIGIAYTAADQFGTWDKAFGREDALKGLHRLESAAGYPESWIYAAGPDRRVFSALLKRIESRIPSETAAEAKSLGLKPVLITGAGSPLQLPGVPDSWQQKDRFYITPSHPVVVVYGSAGTNEHDFSNGKAARACSVGELRELLATEHTTRQFYVGTVMVSCLSIALIMVRSAFRENS